MQSNIISDYCNGFNSNISMACGVTNAANCFFEKNNNGSFHDVMAATNNLGVKTIKETTFESVYVTVPIFMLMVLLSCVLVMDLPNVDEIKLPKKLLATNDFLIKKIQKVFRAIYIQGVGFISRKDKNPKQENYFHPRNIYLYCVNSFANIQSYIINKLNRESPMVIEARLEVKKLIVDIDQLCKKINFLKNIIKNNKELKSLFYCYFNKHPDAISTIKLEPETFNLNSPFQKVAYLGITVTELNYYFDDLKRFIIRFPELRECFTKVVNEMKANGISNPLLIGEK